jgi:hypothetical protein
MMPERARALIHNHWTEVRLLAGFMQRLNSAHGIRQIMANDLLSRQRELSGGKTPFPASHYTPVKTDGTQIQKIKAVAKLVATRYGIGGQAENVVEPENELKDEGLELQKA